MISFINKAIVAKYKPDFTFLMILNVNKMKLRINKRKKLNRYDKFKLGFYKKVQTILSQMELLILLKISLVI